MTSDGSIVKSIVNVSTQRGQVLCSLNHFFPQSSHVKCSQSNSTRQHPNSTSPCRCSKFHLIDESLRRKQPQLGNSFRSQPDVRLMLVHFSVSPFQLNEDLLEVATFIFFFFKLFGQYVTSFSFARSWSAIPQWSYFLLGGCDVLLAAKDLPVDFPYSF